MRLLNGRSAPINKLDFISQGRTPEEARKNHLEVISIQFEEMKNMGTLEEYPEDKYLPSYLVYSQHRDIIFHIVIAVDMQGDNVRIVTAYCPSPENWKEDLKTRR
ncbi:MAG: DUF4258 domain-containing protein [Candidatus Brocadiales bacterium]|nr:DUF4258 domain-containing protein [Candidatus Brocadiales bacterium]